MTPKNSTGVQEKAVIAQLVTVLNIDDGQWRAQSKPKESKRKLPRDSRFEQVKRKA